MPSKTDEPIDFPDEPPTSINPYEVLSIAEDATDDDIKKAYRKAALRHHPDKTPDADNTHAKEKFQEIAFAYAVLSDPRRRKRYDNTGSTAETLDIEDDDFDWLSFFREQWYEVITPELIDKDKQEYRDSGEQRRDLLQAYTKYKGNMDRVYEVVVHSNPMENDVDFRRVLDGAIASGEVEAYDKYTKETEKSKQNRIKKAEREAKEAEKHKEELQNKKDKKTKSAKQSKSEGSEGDLLAMIQSKHKDGQARQSRFLEHLEEKYGGDTGKGRGKKRDEPPESAFAETAKRARRGKAGR